ncbi:MAG: hypothetical protein JWR60_3340 [Polaromonas sp.]|nr:hypothetical protein [Polaromonas sp.]
MSSDMPFLKERLAEAARYALMRRLLPAIRHNIAGTLQPIGMMSAMLERRMKAPAPDMAQLGKNTQALSTLSREAAAVSLGLMGWLAPKDNEPVPLGSAVEESLGLMTTELSFRGFSIANETAGLQVQLPRGILRTVFTASLIALTDAVEGAAKVVVTATTDDGQTHLKVMLVPGGSLELVGVGSRVQTYRNLGWDDVQLLADAEGVSLDYDVQQVHLCYAMPAFAS